MLSISLHAQESDFIEGQLINSKNETTIPFASVLIKNKSKGVVSNIDGGFKIPSELQQLNDTLVISSIGYYTKEVALIDLKKDKVNIIYIKEKIENLGEVIVVASKEKRGKKRKKREKNLSAKNIIKLAIEKIPDNYPFETFSYVGYYRDYQIKEEKYVNLNEALLEVFDSGFETIDIVDTETRIYQYEKNLDFPIDSLAAQPYDYLNKSKIIENAELDNRGGNEFTILRLHDPIRNYNINTFDYVNQLESDFIKNHTFNLLEETSIDNTALYSIEIYRDAKGVIARGRLYISKKDFKIYKLTYTIYDKTKRENLRRQSANGAAVISAEELENGKLLYEVSLEYQLFDGRMYPKYISLHNSFKVVRLAEFRIEEINTNQPNVINLRFSTIPIERNAIEKSNYTILHNGDKWKIERIEIKKYEVFLYMDDSFFESKGIPASGDRQISVEVLNLIDVDGNLINEGEFEDFHQYREFFVQELKPAAEKPQDDNFMIKIQPINKNQPIAPLEDFSDYWLNTPLKNRQLSFDDKF